MISVSDSKTEVDTSEKTKGKRRRSWRDAKIMVGQSRTTFN